jgi:hypothetical protein
MRVKCRSNTAHALPQEYLEPRAGLDQSFIFPLTASASYVVYAIFLRHDAVWYLLSDDNKLPWPIAYPAPLLDVLSNTASGYWSFAFTPEHGDHLAILAMCEWVRDPFFYDRLTDGKPEEVVAFAKARELMDQEEIEAPLA